MSTTGFGVLGNAESGGGAFNFAFNDNADLLSDGSVVLGWVKNGSLTGGGQSSTVPSGIFVDNSVSFSVGAASDSADMNMSHQIESFDNSWVTWIGHLQDSTTGGTQGLSLGIVVDGTQIAESSETTGSSFELIAVSARIGTIASSIKFRVNSNDTTGGTFLVSAPMIFNFRVDKNLLTFKRKPGKQASNEVDRIYKKVDGLATSGVTKFGGASPGMEYFISTETMVGVPTVAVAIDTATTNLNSVASATAMVYGFSLSFKASAGDPGFPADIGYASGDFDSRMHVASFTDI
jgi:hypothetical protein